MKRFRLYILLFILITCKNGFSQNSFVKSFQDKDSFNIAERRLNDYGYKFKTQESKTTYEIVFKDNSKVDTAMINKLINSSGIISLHKSIPKDSILLNFIFAETERIEKSNPKIKFINDSLRNESSSKIILYKTSLDDQKESAVLGYNYKADFDKLNTVLSNINNDNIVLSSYLPYLSRNHETYSLLAFEKNADFIFTSNMYESLDLVLGNKRDYAELKIKLKQEYSESFNSHQKDNYKGREVGFFIDNELFYCPIFVGYSVISISMVFPTNELAKYAYSVLKTTKESSINQTSKNENKLPDYYSDKYYPNIDSLYKSGTSMNDLILMSAYSILNTPDDDRINKRNDLMNFLLDQFGKKSKWSAFMQDELAKKFMKVDQMVWVYYLVCLSKSSVENPDINELELKTDAVSLLINYIFKVANFTSESIESNEFLKELNSTKNKKDMMKILEGI